MRGRRFLAPHDRFLLVSGVVIVALMALFVASLLGTPFQRTHADQSPAGCTSNDFVLNVQKSLTFFSDTTAINYSLLAGNPDSSGTGCGVGGVDLSLTTPDGVVHSLGTGLSFAIGTPVAVAGMVSYTPAATAPAFNGWFGFNGVSWVAAADASGVLLNNPVQDDPWQVRKTVSVLRAGTALSAVVSPPGEVAPGTPVTITFVETNDSVVQLEAVGVTSAQCPVAPVLGGGGANQGDINGNGLLDPGESWIFACTLVVDGPTTVTADATGRLLGSTLVIDPSNDPDERVTVQITTPPPPDPPGDTPPAGDDPIPEDDPPGEVVPVGDDPIPNPRPPGNLPNTGSGGIAGMGGVEPIAYGAIVMGLLTLGLAFVLRRVVGSGGSRRG